MKGVYIPVNPISEGIINSCLAPCIAASHQTPDTRQEREALSEIGVISTHNLIGQPNYIPTTNTMVYTSHAH